MNSDDTCFPTSVFMLWAPGGQINKITTIHETIVIVLSSSPSFQLKYKSSISYGMVRRNIAPANSAPVNHVSVGDSGRISSSVPSFPSGPDDNSRNVSFVLT